ncbi:MAG TPA: PilN domain-containing protein [Burkholderiales bacterium]|nr:PilN domain-containing protein [Burkholderiales bacterium]
MSQQINLFNPIFLKQKRHFSALAMAQALALVLLGVLAMYAYEVRQNRTLAGVLAKADEQLDQRRSQITRFGTEFSTQGASRALANELSAAESRLAQRTSLLDDVKTGVGGDVQGYSRYLTALARQTMPGVWLTGLDIGGKSSALVIKGRALDSALVPAYMRALNRAAPLSGRRVDELRLSAKETPQSPPGAHRDPQAPREPESYIEFLLAIPMRGDS